VEVSLRLKIVNLIAFLESWPGRNGSYYGSQSDYDADLAQFAMLPPEMNLYDGTYFLICSD
jgi:hypothetical protein